MEADLPGVQLVLFGKMIEKILNHKKFKEILTDLNLLDKEQILREKFLRIDSDFLKTDKEVEKENQNIENSENAEKIENFDFKVINIFTDGASSGNPGKAGAGCIFFDKNYKEFFRENMNLGINTNNYAEYNAILLAVKNLENFKNENVFENFNIKFCDIKFNFFSDSELMVKQLTRKYKISNTNLKILAEKFFEKTKNLGINYSIFHIPREKNSLADSIATFAKENKIIKFNKIRQNR